MKAQYHHLTLSDRDRMTLLREDGFSMRKIARTLGIAHSTVSREIKRNARGAGTHHGTPGTYEPAVAHHKAYLRRHLASFRGKKLETTPELRQYVIASLKAGWNPDEMSGRLKRTAAYPYVSKTTIYEWLYSARGQYYCQYLPRARYRPKRRRHPKPGFTIPDRISIHQRPEAANSRRHYGHWEGDTMVSGKHNYSTTSLVVQERKSRYITAQLIPNLVGGTFSTAVTDLLAGKKVISLTLDNGIENRDHALVTQATKADIFFCDPYSSWQKGGVEHANKMLRAYLPKGSNLGAFDPTYIDWVVTRINNKPRRCLGYKSALELAKEKGVIVPRGGAVRG